MTKLDEKGRCCGRKPLVYKRDRIKFCPRCDRAFSILTGHQVANFHWKMSIDTGQFVRVDSHGNPI